MSTPVAFLGTVHACPSSNSPAAHFAGPALAALVNGHPRASAGYTTQYGGQIVVANPTERVGG